MNQIIKSNNESSVPRTAHPLIEINKVIICIWMVERTQYSVKVWWLLGLFIWAFDKAPFATNA